MPFRNVTASLETGKLGRWSWSTIVVDADIAGEIRQGLSEQFSIFDFRFSIGLDRQSEIAYRRTLQSAPTDQDERQGGIVQICCPEYCEGHSLGLRRRSRLRAATKGGNSDCAKKDRT